MLNEARRDGRFLVSITVLVVVALFLLASAAWATDQSLNPNPKCDPVPVLFYLAKYATEDDYGQSSTGEWRDVMTPDPAYVP